MNLVYVSQDLFIQCKITVLSQTQLRNIVQCKVVETKESSDQNKGIEFSMISMLLFDKCHVPFK